MMAVAAARELHDGEIVFVGIGLPNLACNLARATHAPNLVLIYESGAVGATPERLPLSIGDPALVTGARMICSMADVFQHFLQNVFPAAVEPPRSRSMRAERWW
jgi:glutaconate CoA-transferase, subunit B